MLIISKWYQQGVDKSCSTHNVKVTVMLVPILLPLSKLYGRHLSTYLLSELTMTHLRKHTKMLLVTMTFCNN